MTLTRYIIGFVFSLVLTIAAYSLVTSGKMDSWLLLVLGILALAQMLVQLVYFLHLGDEVGPRYKLLSFLFMAGTLFIVVAGSLWIMHNLNYNMMNMTPVQKENYMKSADNMGF